MLKIIYFTLLFISQVSFAQNVSSQIQDSRGIANYLLELQKEELIRRDLFEGQAERANVIISGIPKFVYEINAKNKIFRHYTGKALSIILSSSQLKTGITPYVVISPGYSREVYEDLVGIFLTLPTTPPEVVGLEKNSNADYIDFTLYEGTPVMQIESEIFLIPGRKDYPTWIKELYIEYKKTGKADPHYISLFKKIDASGGINPNYMKVNILSYRSNGIVTNLKK